MKKYSILLMFVATLLFSCGKDAEKPTVVTGQVFDVTSTSAKVTATVESDGGAEVTERGFEYYCSPSCESDHDCYSGVILSGSGLGEYQGEITELAPNETVYVRAYATNEAGTSYGEEISFNTSGCFINGYEYVDLGLPSGLKWAAYNVGATTPYELGDYYAWGELKAKESFEAGNSLTYGIPMEDISGDVEHDVAALSWGSTWRIPTEAEARELKDNCTWEWVIVDNNIWGGFATGPNGKQIFFPSGGFKTETTVGFNEDEAAYWTSSPDNFEHDPGYAAFFYIYSNNFCNIGWMSRYAGMLVRPVSE